MATSSNFEQSVDLSASTSFFGNLSIFWASENTRLFSRQHDLTWQFLLEFFFSLTFYPLTLDEGNGVVQDFRLVHLGLGIELEHALEPTIGRLDVVGFRVKVNERRAQADRVRWILRYQFLRNTRVNRFYLHPENG